MENLVSTQSPVRSRVATLVVVGPASRLADVAETLGGEDESGALHIVRIAIDGSAVGTSETQPDIVNISSLRGDYVNNAIAAVRLSSLPTIVWWRGGRPEALDGVASLADRVVLDTDDPWPLWSRMPPLFEQTALTDIRWARLTRWRAALAHFFDLPPVQQIAGSFSRLSIAAGDAADAALFAGWLDASFGWRGKIAPEFTDSGQGAPMESVTLESESCRLELRLLPHSTCISTDCHVGSEEVASRVVSLGNQTLATLLAEDLRVRSRDIAFEQAVQSALRGR
jgi:glucose-6-phosphate dehydrogenase assembly protein OpcA